MSEGIYRTLVASVLYRQQTLSLSAGKHLAHFSLPVRFYVILCRQQQCCVLCLPRCPALPSQLICREQHALLGLLSKLLERPSIRSHALMPCSIIIIIIIASTGMPCAAQTSCSSDPAAAATAAAADCTIYPSIDVHSISPIYTPIERGG